MSGIEKDGFLPSYEDSISGTSTPTSRFQTTHSQHPRTHSPSRGQHILDQLTLTRAHHINATITTHILPLVEQQALYGIATTTIAMIPSDVPLQPVSEPSNSEFSFDSYGSTSNQKKVEVIGFSSEEEPQIVRLEGQMNRTEFWRVQSVIVELERGLKGALNASETLRPTSPQRAEETMAKQGRRNFFGRVADAVTQEQRSSSGNPASGMGSLDTAEQVLVKVRLEEICLRTVNEFGLYDTMSKQCVIVRVDARC